MRIDISNNKLNNSYQLDGVRPGQIHNSVSDSNRINTRLNRKQNAPLEFRCAS